MREIELTQGKVAVAYIYALCDPRDGAVRYVGKSCAPKQRLRRHLADLDATTRKRRWINSLITAGLEPKLNILETTNEDDWPKAERRWIAFYKGLGIDLVNTDKGGRGRPKGSKHSPEARRKIAEKLQGHAVSRETRKRLSIANRGRPLSQEHKENLSKAHKERWAILTKSERQEIMSHLIRAWTPQMKLKASQTRQGRKYGESSSPYLGVTWFKRDGKWRAYIWANGKQQHLGYFSSEFDAARAYDDAARELFGEFARLNFPKEGERSAIG